MKKLANLSEMTSGIISLNHSYWSVVMGAMFTLALVACGDNVTNESITQIMQDYVAVVSDASKLPECTTENEGEQAFVKGETASRICVDGSWQVLFSAAVDKQNELKCSTESLADGSGVKILCNGDSIGVLLNGVDGANGKSAYEIAKAGGYKGTEAEWLESLNGADGVNGTDGKNGANGKSAYEIAKAGGYTGTEAEWLESLKGADGANGTDGKNGANGKSAYELAKAGGYMGTEADWLESLKGADGTNGQSAYELAKAGGYTGTEAEWLESLKGANGKSCSFDNVCGSIFLTCGDDKFLLGFDSTYMMLTDKRDQKSYRTVLIGEQCWMAENLNFDDSLSYPVLKNGSRCLNDLSDSCEKYGRLYSWSVAVDSAGFFSDNAEGCGQNKSCSPVYPVRGICPEGWHLPTDAEFETLISAVGGNETVIPTGGTSAYKALRSTRRGGTNSSGFNALGGGYWRGPFFGGDRFWGSFVDNPVGGRYQYMGIEYNSVISGCDLYTHWLYSVRCIQD